MFFQICEKYHDKIEMILILVCVYELMNVAERDRFSVSMACLERLSLSISSALTHNWEAEDTSSIVSTPTGMILYGLITNAIQILIIS